MNRDLLIKKIKFRCCHRGIKEMDVLFEKFVNSPRFQDLTDKELDDLQYILNENDIDILRWIYNPSLAPKNINISILVK